MISAKRLTLALLGMTVLGGCTATTSSLGSRQATAASIALPAGMTERVIPAGIFNLTVWERVQNPAAPLHVYIEGDGLAWINRYAPSLNPTPPRPQGLLLAAEDNAENVIYIARPCQYTGWQKDGPCPSLYWTNGRTAPEVLTAYQEALNNIKATHHAGSGYHLTGYSGGAAVAVLAAAERDDVLSLRTVAGNTHYAAFTTLHKISPMNASRDPISVAAKIAHIPQRHFIGEDDKIIPAAVFERWKAASGNSACVQIAIIPDATHEKGWTERWGELLKTPVTCTP